MQSYIGGTASWTADGMRSVAASGAVSGTAREAMYGMARATTMVAVDLFVGRNLSCVSSHTEALSRPCFQSGGTTAKKFREWPFRSLSLTRL